MKKCDRIMALHAKGMSTRQIAGLVYSVDADASPDEWDKRMAYVRIVIRQRRGGSESSVDHKYLKRRYGSRKLTTCYNRRYEAFIARHPGYWRDRYRKLQGLAEQPNQLV